MARTPESKVKAKVVKILKDAGAYYFYPMGTGYGSSGVPDIIACYKGDFIGIECKAGKNRPTALQEKNIRGIRKAGGISMVVNEVSIQAVTDMLRTLDEMNAELLEDDWI